MTTQDTKTSYWDKHNAEVVSTGKKLLDSTKLSPSEKVALLSSVWEAVKFLSPRDKSGTYYWASYLNILAMQIAMIGGAKYKISRRKKVKKKNT